MDFIIPIAAGLVAAILGIGGTNSVLRLRKKREIRQAEEEAAELVQLAKEEAETLLEEAKLSAEEAEDLIWDRYESELFQLQEKIKVREDEYRRRRSQFDRNYNQDLRAIQKQTEDVKEEERRLENRKSQVQSRQTTLDNLRVQLIEELRKTVGVDIAEMKQDLITEFLNQVHIDVKKRTLAYEEEVRSGSEELAKKLIGSALNRFIRPACTERGIGVVAIPNEDVKKRMLGPEGKNIQFLQSLCGLEIALTEANTFQVVSFDPVRREVTTRCLEKLLHERSPNEEVIQRIFDKTSKDVQRKIEADGHRVAAELGQKDLHIEIKKMLGVLRYRYSFAQNQHFHVAEVGWLCGLLASELGGVAITSAKRAGLLHDVGKAMDHKFEGGHAVIGADFIQSNGEKQDIVHAVRAHHFEEQPSTDLAFLVIAADAISGSRPGARRSTVSVYNQKIEALTTIAEGMSGVTKTLILNAGREVRVIVDGRRINDEESLRMCRDIAVRIEKECQYPGQIKVVVIRETHAEAVAK